MGDGGSGGYKAVGVGAIQVLPLQKGAGSGFKQHVEGGWAQHFVG